MLSSGDSSDEVEDDRGERYLDIQQRLRAVCQTFISLSCTDDLTATSKNHAPVTAVITAGEETLKSLPNIPTAFNNDKLFSQVKSARDKAMEGLQAAFANLKSEIAVASVANRCKSAI